MANLKMKNINKLYESGIHAVNDFNMEIKDGEFVVLVGPSGCGKSTMLRMIAGLETITGGELVLGDKVLNNVAPADRNIAMVFQNYALFTHLSVYENMGISLSILHEDKDVIHEKIMDAVKIVDLKRELNRKPKALSGGQRQRVALGRSVVRDAEIFLMDEPLSNLDAKLRAQTRKEIVQLNRKLEKTFVYVTHDQVEAMTMADRVVVMNNGVIQQIGTPAELYEQPSNVFVGGFIGSPAMNFLYGKIKNGVFLSDDIKIKLQRDMVLGLEKDYSEGIIMGIRPEVFSLAGPDDEFIDADVDVVEYLGCEYVIGVKIRGINNICMARLDASNVTINVGDSIKLAINKSKIHLFDSESEARIV